MLSVCLISSCKEHSANSLEKSEQVQEEVVENPNEIVSVSESSGEFRDGTYCSEVEYYNPSTGTRNTYKLNVEVEGGELTIIHWPNGGWLDNSHFYPQDIANGQCEFSSDKGYRYTVTLNQFGGCSYTDEYKIRRDVNNEATETTCPKCGNEKYSYDEMCDDCKEKIEQTCPKCGGHKFSKFDEVCDDCKAEQEDDQ